MASLILKIYTVVKVKVQIKSSVCWIKHHENKAFCGVEACPIFAHNFIVGCNTHVLLHVPAVLPLENSSGIL
jgi:hypothetical protein